jgi:hypothetical protein
MSYFDTNATFVFLAPHYEQIVLRRNDFQGYLVVPQPFHSASGSNPWL